MMSTILRHGFRCCNEVMNNGIRNYVMKARELRNESDEEPKNGRILWFLFSRSLGNITRHLRNEVGTQRLRME
jgi:hypothetical protein